MASREVPECDTVFNPDHSDVIGVGLHDFQTNRVRK
jgi:hypothetical protein